jgi:hypothetical protein
MRINKEYFLPLVKEFCQTANEIGQAGYPVNGLFVPYTFEKYATAPKKIFYVGRDTYGWVPFADMMNDYNNGELSNYLEKNANVVTVQGKETREKYRLSLKESFNYNKTEFWPFCQKLHMYITKGLFSVDIQSLIDEDYQVMEQMGYGNLNSIEHDETLKKVPQEAPIWYRIDRPKFRQLRQASRNLDKILHILKAYNPDLIIILNGENRDDVLDGLQIQKVIHCSTIPNIRQDIYTLEGYSTQILWSIHPNSFKFNSTNLEQMLKSLGDTARDLLNIK